MRFINQSRTLYIAFDKMVV